MMKELEEYRKIADECTGRPLFFIEQYARAMCDIKDVRKKYKDICCAWYSKESGDLMEEAIEIIRQSLTTTVGTADYARRARSWLTKVGGV